MCKDRRKERTVLRSNWEVQDQTIHSVLGLQLRQLWQWYSKLMDRKAKLYRGAKRPEAVESLS